MGSFVGRAHERARLAELTRSRASLITIWGPGGVGKTRLAREHVEAERRAGRHVAWADLAAARTRPEAVDALASALGLVLPTQREQREQREQRDEELDAVAHAAAARGGLLVADNAEQLDATARRALVELTASNPKRSVSLIVTSREPLGAPHEEVIALAPLDEDDAVTLFLARAGAHAEHEPTDAVRAIVRRLDALPLALELAAARLPLLGAQELLARLDRKLDVLASANGGSPRQSTLRALVAWSWDLLDDASRVALAACAAFEAAFDAPLAEAVMDLPERDALDALERLHSSALLVIEGRARPQRMRLFEAVRDFAREHAPAANAERHANAVLARSEPLAEAVRAGGGDLRAIEALLPDLSAIAQHAPAMLAARACLVLAARLVVTGPLAAALAYAERAETLARDEAVLRLRAATLRGDALRALGRFDEARAALEEPAREGPDAERAEALRVLGSVLRATGDVEAALAAKNEARMLLARTGQHAREGACIGEIGAVLQSAGRLRLAQEHHAEAIAIHVACGSRRAEGIDRSFLAVATHRAGEPAAAVPLHEAALAIHREVGHTRLEGAELLHLAFVHHELGALVRARETFGLARTTLARAGARGLEAFAAVLEARLAVDAHEPAHALLLLGEAEATAPAAWPRLVAMLHLVRGHRASSTGDHEAERVSYEAALATNADVEVGFEALTPAYLALASARTGGTAREVEALLARAHEALARTENRHLRTAFAILAAGARREPPPPVASDAAASSSEVRRALVQVGLARALVVDDDARQITLPDGRLVDLARRKNVRLVLLALVRARRERPGEALGPSELIDAGWPGERMRGDAATKRLHTAVWTLRTLGLEGILVTDGEGYLLDPGTDLRFREPPRDL